MRLFLIPLFCLPLPLGAETIQALAQPDRVTVFPEGANVEHLVSFTSEVGAHRIVVPGLPDGLEITDLRIAVPEGVTLHTATLSTDRLPVTDETKPDSVKTAEDEVDRLQEQVAKRDDEIAAMRLSQTAADAQTAFLNRLGSGDTAAAAPDTARALGVMIGEEVSAAQKKAIASRAEIRAAEKLREDDQKALDKAIQYLAAMSHPEVVRGVLTLDLETAKEGESVVGIMTYSQEAGWAPAYDMYLSRRSGTDLHVKRSVLVAQTTGEDWTNVDLILSTARPNESPDTYLPQPERVAVESAEERSKRFGGGQFDESGGMAEPVMEPEVALVGGRLSGGLVMVGDTVTYHYPNRVTLRDGADQMQLALDELDLKATTVALAVPIYSDTAYVSAEVTNGSAEILLPGKANLYVDGAYRGQSNTPLIAAEDTAKIGFGAIDGIRLKRTVENRSEGDRGIISKSNQRDEAVVIEIRNLTDEAWPLKVVDRIPYSEQDDLIVSYKAVPAETQKDAEGQRGILTWDLELKAGETKEIRLEHSLNWPDGMVLQ